MDKQVYLNKILSESIKNLEDEVGGLLGQEFSCPDPVHSLASRDDLLATLKDKAVLATLSVSGDNTGTAYVIVGLKDAITLGGTLILLPPDEMAARRKSALFDGEVSDAYGEIANIMAGVYTAVFNEHANPKLHFKKTDLTLFSPGSPDAPVPAGDYYISTCSTLMAGKPLGVLSVLIPPDLLGLEPAEEQTAPAEQPAPTAGQRSTSNDPAVILVVSETQQSAESFAQNFINRCNCSVTCMHFQGDFQTTTRGKNVKGVFLAMREVGERGLASIIKIQSAVGEKTPLIAAGPAWTRKTVLQAVKYGASDILVTPAATEELLEKIQQHMKIAPN